MKIIVIIMALILSKNIYAKDTVAESYNIDGYINSLNEVVQKEEGIDVDLNSIYSDIINGKKEAKQSVIQRVISLVISQIKETLKASIAIVLIVLLEMILSSIELDKNSQSVKIAKLVIIASAATILLKNYIEVHHIKPLSSLDEEIIIDPYNDLACLCANCHRMMHRNSGHVMTVEELKRAYRE